MRIVLLRHGKPHLTSPKRIKARNMQHWIDNYNTAELDTSASPSTELIELATQCQQIVCSNQSRSLDSAKVLNLNTVHESDPLFREFGMPYRKIPFVKLTPTLWAIIFRLSWLMGFSLNSESFEEAKIRAENAANRLIKMAEDHNDILLIGHGLLNKFIAKQLLSEGWSCSKMLGRKHWEYGIFEKE
ncbi:MAG: hypothetical protein ISEC1_P1039 [Thiomicrorhabdus sp.]|nr:MAG: hypothetical protein ISEC1_P1039 [Thiomicrorhabdus sp.]